MLGTKNRIVLLGAAVGWKDTDYKGTLGMSEDDSVIPFLDCADNYTNMWSYQNSELYTKKYDSQVYKLYLNQNKFVWTLSNSTADKVASWGLSHRDTY